jgi:hypothetical protein
MLFLPDFTRISSAKMAVFQPFSRDPHIKVSWGSGRSSIETFKKGAIVSEFCAVQNNSAK